MDIEDGQKDVDSQGLPIDIVFVVDHIDSDDFAIRRRNRLIPFRSHPAGITKEVQTEKPKTAEQRPAAYANLLILQKNQRQGSGDTEKCDPRDDRGAMAGQSIAEPTPCGAAISGCGFAHFSFQSRNS